MTRRDEDPTVSLSSDVSQDTTIRGGTGVANAFSASVGAMASTGASIYADSECSLSWQCLPQSEQWRKCAASELKGMLQLPAQRASEETQPSAASGPVARTLTDVPQGTTGGRVGSSSTTASAGEPIAVACDALRTIAAKEDGNTNTNRQNTRTIHKNYIIKLEKRTKDFC